MPFGLQRDKMLWGQVMRGTGILFLSILGFTSLQAQTGRRLASDPPQRLRPNVQTSGCPAESTVASATHSSEATDFVEVQRSSCFGACPAYKVRIQADGAIAWMGEHDVRHPGPSSSQSGADEARALIERFVAAGFWDLCATYNRPVTDLPTTITILSVGTQQKPVSDRADGAPDWLRELDREVDALSDTHQWIHGDARTEMFSFNLNSDARGPKPGWTGLMGASGRREAAEIQLLLAGNANVNAQDASGWTALMYATVARQPEALQMLLDAGANPAIASYTGQTAVMAAAMAFYAPERKLQSLLAARAKLDAQDLDGKTALMYAIERQFEQPDVIAFLLQAGARTDIRDSQGLTAKDYVEREAARRKNQEAQAERLRQLLN